MRIIPDKIQVLFIEEKSELSDATIKHLELDKHIEFNVIQCNSLQEGLKFIQSECSMVENCIVDIILLDLMLPNSEGIATYQRVRQNCDFLPIVIISRHEDIACQCVKLGAQDFLLKPDLTTNVLTRSLKYAIERKKLEDDRMLLENQFNEVISSTPLGVHIYELQDGELVFTGYNPGADIVLKVNNINFIGKTIDEAFPSLDPKVKENYLKVIETGIPWNKDSVEYEGESIKGSFRVHAFKTGSNRMATSFEDITIKAKMEEALRKSEKRYREIVEATNAGIYEIDFINDRFTYINNVMCKLTGWTKEELLEMSPTEFLTEKSLNEWIERWEALNRGEHIQESFEYQVKKKDGSTGWALVTAQYKEDETGLVVGARVIAIDITKEKAAKEEIKRKEDIIFNELESRLHQWRAELTSSTIEKQIRDVGLNIQSITDTFEVQ